ncbi:hexosaminidase [Mucilaginibacter pineti]|uniref:beta-N-acetylhexosaminidase n=1 Tax=Mucilaginibacter pineti TaxID=1391627 RepID=A0A1G7KTP5_9SPHI|nr:family 20 glycosylhydrolase [Mucilaginibacter pineti]SDF40310.1 hexosaminidase [Mucilaginibacter pineti]
MNKLINPKILFKRLAFSLVAICLSLTQVQAQFHIIPQPLHLSAQKGYFSLSSKNIIGVDKESEAVGNYLQTYLAQNYKLHLKVKVYAKVPATAAIKLVTGSTAGKEGAYALKVTPGKIAIAGNGAGVFYGVQSLIQLLHTVKPAAILQVMACDIADEPRFQWRGLSLDVCRHFFTVEEVKKYIDVMAHYKLNVFHWHLTDDEGWRIQIDKYPKLTEVGAKISYYEKLGKFRKLDNLIDGGRDGFYTKDDIRSVIKYAQDRFITILPEIEMPGHSEAAIFAYPELGCQDSTGAKHRVRMLDPSEHTFTFMEDVLTEVIALFPNQYIHIGGDEAEMIDWLKSPTAVALMKKEGLTNEKEIQSYFIKRIEKFLISKNKKLVGWDEILQGGLAESATVMSWQGEAGGIAAAKMHHHVIMTPLPYMYFDAPQANEDLEPIGWNPPVTWQMVYNYEPQSKELTPEEAAYILGVQGNIWVEKIPNLPHLEYMVYPRALALAELAWSAKEDKNIDRFEYKMKQQYGLFKLWNLNARLPDIVGVDNLVTNKDQYNLTLKYPLVGAKVRYTLDGKAPDSASTAVNFPVKIARTLKDSLFLKTYTTWTLNKQHIRQVAYIKHITVDPAKESAAKLTPGLSYKLIKTKETNPAKLDTVTVAVTAIINSAVPMVQPVTDGNITWAKFSGFIKIDTEGDYEITSGFEISPELLLDGEVIISRGKNTYVEPQKALLHLKKGIYTLAGEYIADALNTNQTLIRLKTAGGKELNAESYLFHL